MKIERYVFLLSLGIAVVAGAETEVPLLEGERWWGGKVADGRMMPFSGNSSYHAQLDLHHGANQAAPLLISDRGRYVWCDKAFGFSFPNGVLRTDADITPVCAGRTLREAFLGASKAHFPPSGRMPPAVFFSAPQYNTWIELQYNQNQKDILKYAKDIVANGLPPGVIMIDDTWQAGYGDWRFEAFRFSDPKSLCDELHAMGFKVMLWMCPFITMDSPTYRRLRREGGLVIRKGRDPAVIDWWNGKSAVLDLTHPNARAWFSGELNRLCCTFGVDGFKFDGGNVEHYQEKNLTHIPLPGVEQQCTYASYGLEFPYNEYRCCWKMAGQPLVQRLLDKMHNWRELRRCVTDLIAASIIGHSFVCPDMIGGGDYRSFLPGAAFDPELFIRSAQVHALSPMMQFSASPWRVLDEEGQRIIRETVSLRQRFAPRFVELAGECAKTGEPMLRHMEYAFPRQGLADVSDQFVMGDFLIVAPQLEKGAAARTVRLPAGVWLADDGSRIKGPVSVKIDTPLARLPHFVRAEQR